MSEAIQRVDKKPVTKLDVMKYQVAEELGLLDKVLSRGWAALTASESGKIGGIVRVRNVRNGTDKRK